MPGRTEDRGSIGTLVIETDWGELEVGRIFHEKPARLAKEILGTLRRVAEPGHPALAVDLALVVRDPNPADLAFWSLIRGLPPSPAFRSSGDRVACPGPPRVKGSAMRVGLRGSGDGEVRVDPGLFECIDSFLNNHYFTL